MLIELKLNKLVARIAALAVVAGACALLAASAMNNFIVGAFTDSRAAVTQDELEAAAHYCPNSALIEGKLAEAEAVGAERDLTKADAAAARAISLSPNSYDLRLVLAAIKESEGDRAAAEEAIRSAAKLAPFNSDVQWRLANLMLREGRIEDSLPSFQIAIKASPSLLPAAMALVWRYTNGRPDLVARIVPDAPVYKVRLARFLMRQSQPQSALKVFNSIDGETARACPESWDFLRELMDSNDVGNSRLVWLSLTGVERRDELTNLIFNGGFERDPVRDQDQFDWKVTPSDAAQVFIDPGVSHSGGRSLRIEFEGHDTTRLDGNVKQLTAVKPGAHYRLQFYVRTEKLVTTAGPQIAVSSSSFPQWSSRSAPIAPGTSDWSLQSLDFVAPGAKGGPAIPLVVGFVRTPKLNYETAMSGIVWLDEFDLSEVPE